jgi:hypothetical protein
LSKIDKYYFDKNHYNKNFTLIDSSTANEDSTSITNGFVRKTSDMENPSREFLIMSPCHLSDGDDNVDFGSGGLACGHVVLPDWD